MDEQRNKRKPAPQAYSGRGYFLQRTEANRSRSDSSTGVGRPSSVQFTIANRTLGYRDTTYSPHFPVEYGYHGIARDDASSSKARSSARDFSNDSMRGHQQGNFGRRESDSNESRQQTLSANAAASQSSSYRQTPSALCEYVTDLSDPFLTRVYCTRLSPETTAEGLKEKFKQWTAIVGCTIEKGPMLGVGQSSNNAYLYFNDYSNADLMVRNERGTIVKRRCIGMELLTGGRHQSKRSRDEEEILHTSGTTKARNSEQLGGVPDAYRPYDVLASGLVEREVSRSWSYQRGGTSTMRAREADEGDRTLDVYRQERGPAQRPDTTAGSSHMAEFRKMGQPSFHPGQYLDQSVDDSCQYSNIPPSRPRSMSYGDMGGYNPPKFNLSYPMSGLEPGPMMSMLGRDGHQQLVGLKKTFLIETSDIKERISRLVNLFPEESRGEMKSYCRKFVSMMIKLGDEYRTDSLIDLIERLYRDILFAWRRKMVDRAKDLRQHFKTTESLVAPLAEIDSDITYKRIALIYAVVKMKERSQDQQKFDKMFGDIIPFGPGDKAKISEGLRSSRNTGIHDWEGPLDGEMNYQKLLTFIHTGVDQMELAWARQEEDLFARIQIVRDSLAEITN
ncbi:hypothetical protein DL98DRAFT_533808 [Cadophora sp. DSE1049]|nr:hypothetical protein DL98DRAFT_533808 [Cadophora sp. DSE1049]